MNRILALSMAALLDDLGYVLGGRNLSPKFKQKAPKNKKKKRKIAQASKRRNRHG